MSFIQIDDTKCKKDGICVLECPVAILRQQDKKSPPQMVEGGDQICLTCGHCVSVCPHGALNHLKTTREECPPIEADLVIDQKQAIQFLRTRRSIRNFKQKRVEKEEIQFLIDNARYAPTGSNSQSIEWTVHTDEDKIKEIADLSIDWMREFLKSAAKTGLVSYFPMIVAAYESGIDTVTRNAPCIVTASAPKTNVNGTVDLSIALSYLELMAVPKGLGTCWAGLVKRALQSSDPLRKLMGLPESHTHFYPIMIGYPRFRYHRLPERKQAIIHWN
ncbi:MAG: 4Fe-4S dicluster domain-containing protein [Deltaproteobacteria bacterium]|jgi:nitroreductase/NAD-dependent dihydropyrimidine dehydrogenase PreA subunit|nr:4Fe-4S dicluster domain-containing protein [Deltaproteobacteria bacterium]MBT4089628.1 4Fe-4S dicluster domain-containing protein [Deltaproteobacteria bacterium]MBT4263091.1 4Fe-4S dicluster domain-containing protein [Deltaproteobacteria bacterium]MBT4643442.1 4Fe-4S dicluster domain-containing protein [Deltaproteobacteria bacterium]MBT6502491.1 4Fe-4S dicluster domain-containing protein [Deltaproteobacteria bacterium]